MRYRTVNLKHANTAFLILMMLWITAGVLLWTFQGAMTGIAWFLGGIFLPTIEKRPVEITFT